MTVCYIISSSSHAAFQSIFFVSNSMPYNECHVMSYNDAVIAINTELSANTMDLTSEFTIELVISDGTAGVSIIIIMCTCTHIHMLLLVPGAFKSHLYTVYLLIYRTLLITQTLFWAIFVVLIQRTLQCFNITFVLNIL